MPDFSKIWATNSPLPEFNFTDEEYLTGWDFVAAAPPTKTQFDAWFRQTDEKLKWLYDKLNDTANAIYPVGSVYISFSATSPASLFGGTWARLKDTFLLANGDSYAANTTGGSATKSISVNNLPAHNHSVNSAGAHTHTASSASNGAHKHTASSASNGAHKHTVTTESAGAHTHTRGNMNIVGTLLNNGSTDDEYLTYADDITGTGALRIGARGTTKAGIYSTATGSAYNEISFNASRSGAWTGATSSSGAHTHTVTVSENGAHTHSITINSNGTHNHSVTVNSNGAHTHTTNNTGGSQPINIMPPYTTVYMWRRTA